MANPSKSETAVRRERSTQSTARRTLKRAGKEKRTSKPDVPHPKGSPARPGTKTAALITLLDRKEGATIADLMKATTWQAHSVRGAISGTLKKKLGLPITSERIEGRGRVYRIAAGG